MYTELEERVKSLIAESLKKRIKGLGAIDNVVHNKVLLEQWIIDIMALGANELDFELASVEIYNKQVPMMEAGMLPILGIESYRARVLLSYNRFAEEVEAFGRYVELRDSEDEEAVLFAVRQELEGIEEGDFELY